MKEVELSKMNYNWETFETHLGKLGREMNRTST